MSEWVMMLKSPPEKGMVVCVTACYRSPWSRESSRMFFADYPRGHVFSLPENHPYWGRNEVYGVREYDKLKLWQARGTRKIVFYSDESEDYFDDAEARHVTIRGYLVNLMSIHNM